MTSSNVQTTATLSTSSSVRPRANRLISGLSDTADSDLPPTTPGLPPPSPFDSRSASPIPAAHPQRSVSRNNEQKYAGSNSWGRRAQVAAQQQRNGPVQSAGSPTLAGLWGTSWTTLQGIASDFLSEASEGTSNATKKMPVPKWYKHMTAPPQDESRGWGPPTSTPVVSDIGKGTKEAQQAAMRAQKRKDMLLRQESSYSDTLGKFKRRLSDDTDTRSAPPGGGDDRASLVYLHRVQKEDTMAGITIKYSCSANVLRKANGMWTNDTPQSRQVMVIPVGECSVKGRPVDKPDILDLNTDDDAATPKASKLNGTINHRHSTDSASSFAANNDTEPPWQHDSWVQLPGFPAPTEIARLSRRTLGYFPPARRKSPSRSDTNTPSTSLDLIRGSDDMRTESRSPQRPRRRRLSNANNGYFPSYLAGPGGVGTMNKNVRTPGPAQDGLNKIFAKHLPDVAPPKNQIDLYQPEMPMDTDDITPTNSGMSTPSGTGRANRPPNMNLENVGGAIEGWVRRMATKAMTPTEAQARYKAARASVGTPGKGAGGIGDLIEMTNDFEIGGSDDDAYAVEDEPENPPRGRPNATASAHSTPRVLTRQSASGADYFGNAAVGRRERKSETGKAKKAD